MDRVLGRVHGDRGNGGDEGWGALCATPTHLPTPGTIIYKTGCAGVGGAGGGRRTQPAHPPQPHPPQHAI